MRHSRKAVMTERYKLYMKKHIFNGRYFVRNIQIGVGFVLLMALVIGVVSAGHSSEKETVTASAQVSVKDALFGNSEDETVAVRAEEKSTEAVAEADTEEMTEVATSEEMTEAATEAQTSGSEMADYYNKSEEVANEQAERDRLSKFSDRCIANVEETLNIRQEPDAESEFVGSMNPGAIAKVVGTDGEWTKIKSGDVEGYVLSDYILTGEAAEEFSEDYVTLRGSILEDGVNIREEASTDADILQVLDKDDTISVLDMPEEETEIKADSEDVKEIDGNTESISEQIDNQIEEASDEKADVNNEQDAEITWLSVMLEDGRTGYVSAELVDVEELYELAVSAEELQRIAEEEEAAKRAAEEEAARQAMAEAQQSSGGTNGGSTTASNDDYQGATTTPVTATESGECLGTFTITAYCGCKKCSGGSKKTASGTTPTEGRTIAADTSILPYGTQVVIDGIVYTVEDCGSGVKGNHIDIFFATHEKALAYGRKSVKVYKY